VRQRLGDETAAIDAKVAAGVGLLVVVHDDYSRDQSAARTAAMN
jgi:hypothetical protein